MWHRDGPTFLTDNVWVGISFDGTKLWQASFVHFAVCNYEASPRYCTFANSWSTPCREHSTCLYLCTVLLLRLVHET